MTRRHIPVEQRGTVWHLLRNSVDATASRASTLASVKSDVGWTDLRAERGRSGDDEEISDYRRQAMDYGSQAETLALSSFNNWHGAQFPDEHVDFTPTVFENDIGCASVLASLDGYAEWGDVRSVLEIKVPYAGRRASTWIGAAHARATGDPVHINEDHRWQMAFQMMVAEATEVWYWVLIPDERPARYIALRLTEAAFELEFHRLAVLLPRYAAGEREPKLAEIRRIDAALREEGSNGTRIS